MTADLALKIITALNPLKNVQNLNRGGCGVVAYYLAKNSSSYISENKSAKKNADAERIVKNAGKAGSLSSVGQSSPISEAKRYKDMSDDEFRNTVSQNLGYY